jgi:hypothetical protein
MLADSYPDLLFENIPLPKQTKLMLASSQYNFLDVGKVARWRSEQVLNKNGRFIASTWLGKAIG